MNAETAGEHTVKFEDKALREEIVHMLKGNSSKPVWVSLHTTYNTPQSQEYTRIFVIVKRCYCSIKHARNSEGLLLVFI